MNRTSFDKDINSPLAELFLQTRDYIKICIGNRVKEVKNKTLTSYKTSLGSYCSLKIRDDKLHIIWNKWISLDDTHDVCTKKGTKVTFQIVKSLDKQTRKIIRDYIDQTTVILLEYSEMKKMRKKRYE